MIDTDKYEGHTEGEWKLLGDDESWYAVKTPKHDDPMAFIERRNDDGEVVSLSKADAQLIADAPLLLEAYKRLRLDLASGRITTIVNPNDDHNRTLYVTIEFPDGEVYRGYVEKEGDEE